MNNNSDDYLFIEEVNGVSIEELDTKMERVAN